jgi:integrase
MRINIFKMMQRYYAMTLSTKKKPTQDYELNLIRSLERALQFLGVDQPKKINIETGYDLVKYFKIERKNSNNSINKYIWYLKKVLKYHGISTNFYDFKKLSEDTKHFQAFTDCELRKVIHYARDLNSTKNSLVYRCLVFLLLDSGMRISELLAVRIQNVDLKKKRIFLEKTKTSFQRVAPMSDLSKKDLEKLMKRKPERDLLFYNFIADRPLVKNDVRNFYRRAMEATGVKRIHSHRFRKTFATKLRDNGCRIEALQILLGHAKLSTTLLYIDTSSEMTFSEYEKHNHWGV